MKHRQRYLVFQHGNGSHETCGFAFGTTTFYRNHYLSGSGHGTNGRSLALAIMASFYIPSRSRVYGPGTRS